jgi:hypothetical protein
MSFKGAARHARLFADTTTTFQGKFITLSCHIRVVRVVPEAWTLLGRSHPLVRMSFVKQLQIRSQGKDGMTT